MRDFQTDIERTHQLIADCLSGLQQCEKDIPAAEEEGLARFFVTRAREIIEDDETNTREIGMESVVMIREKVANLASQTRSILDQYRQPSRKIRALLKRLGDGPTDDTPLRLAMGHLATVLEPFGYLKPKIRTKTTTEFILGFGHDVHTQHFYKMWRPRAPSRQGSIDYEEIDPSGPAYCPDLVVTLSEIRAVENRRDELLKRLETLRGRLAELRRLAKEAETEQFKQEIRKTWDGDG